MKMESFSNRLQSGKVNNYTYTHEGRTRLISTWNHESAFVLTWEECEPGREHDEHLYTKDEKRTFVSVDELVGFLRMQGIDVEKFTP